MEEIVSMIAGARRSMGWSMRDLAAHLGVNVSTVSRMERSEREGTIQLSTLRRALDVMDRDLELQPVNRRREERVSMALHRAIARKLTHSPEDVLAVIPENLERIRHTVRGPIAESWMTRWEHLARGPVEELIEAMLDDTPEGRELRQNSPFAGALSPDERIRAIEEGVSR
ncbi:helix-turn-helix domain-containing protein [Agromyces sp. GXS1127]|uniref:helix-turn-helix domain-containing protein n=1 Tax=Agromyces sp. GXS1127 TaxID=3424181 RepID=UPI003D32397D